MKQVKILYKYVDGAHFFVSDDEKTLGLCVAHTDLETAYNAVSAELNKLFKENYDEDIDFQPEYDVRSFRHWLDQQAKLNMSGPAPGIAAMLPWMKGDMQAA